MKTIHQITLCLSLQFTIQKAHALVSEDMIYLMLIGCHFTLSVQLIPIELCCGSLDAVAVVVCELLLFDLVIIITTGLSPALPSD